MARRCTGYATRQPPCGRRPLTARPRGCRSATRHGSGRGLAYAPPAGPGCPRSVPAAPRVRGTVTSQPPPQRPPPVLATRPPRALPCLPLRRPHRRREASCATTPGGPYLTWPPGARHRRRSPARTASADPHPTGPPHRVKHHGTRHHGAEHPPLRLPGAAGAGPPRGTPFPARPARRASPNGGPTTSRARGPRGHTCPAAYRLRGSPLPSRGAQPCSTPPPPPS